MTHHRPAHVAGGMGDILEGVRLTSHDAASAAARFDDVRRLYEEVFAEPPHSEGPDEFGLFATRWWPRQLAEPGFQLVLADHADHGVLGATYGHQLTADTGWWDGALEPIADTTEQPGRTVAIIEMMVRRRWRRQGLATAMHDRFIDGRTEVRVTLLVRPDNGPARQGCQRGGYDIVGQIKPGRTAPIYDAMIRART